jgi:hypothetical protein
VPELTEPLTGPLTAPWVGVLRLAVREHALGERRRRYLPLLHVGRPGGRAAVVAASGDDAPAPHDDALRVDVVAALLRRIRTGAGAGTGSSDGAGPGTGEEPLVWLTRSGDLDLQDVDVHWLAAARAACAEAGLDLTMVVVTRHGWLDPRTGATRRWARVRRR